MLSSNIFDQLILQHHPTQYHTKRVVDTPVHGVHFTLASSKHEMYTYADVALLGGSDKPRNW